MGFLCGFMGFLCGLVLFSVWFYVLLFVFTPLTAVMVDIEAKHGRFSTSYLSSHPCFLSLLRKKFGLCSSLRPDTEKYLKWRP